jgi:hypothetical protein
MSDQNPYTTPENESSQNTERVPKRGRLKEYLFAAGVTVAYIVFAYWWYETGP